MKNKCAAFWKHTNIRNNNKIYPCCRYKTSVATFDGDVEGILHSDVYKKLRQSKYLEGCAKCYYEESQGKQSLRQRFNEEYDTNTVELKYLELGLDNICNLTCDGCFGDFSSEWSKIEQPTKSNEYHIRSTKDFKNVPDSVDKILFLGGEPLMTKRHLKVLGMVKDKQNTSVTYNTNGTFLLDIETQEMLKQFKKVNFILSIDGYGKLNDKVRGGSNWNDILKFINQIKTLELDLSVNSVLHINNWQGIVELEQFVNELKVEWTVNALTYPKHLDINTTNEPTLVINEIKKTNIPNKDYIINHIRSGLLVDHTLYPYLEQCKNTIQILIEELKTFDYVEFFKTGIKKYDDSFTSPYYQIMQSSRSLKDIIPNGYYSCDNSVDGVDIVEEIDKPNDIANWLYIILYEKYFTVDLDKINHFQKTIADLKMLPGIKHLSIHWMENEFMSPYHNDVFTDNNIVSLLYTISLENPDKYVLHINEEQFNLRPNSFFSFRPEVYHRVENNTGNTWIGVMMRIDRAYFKNV
jgi:sulfatase maturation enzyme AslB (radical SAM superfamily)